MSSEDSLKSLSLDYLNLLINGQAFSDVAFSVEGRLVHAHRCVLAARSLFFRKLFCGLDPNHQPPPTPGSSAAGARAPELVIPVSSIRYEVLVLVLQFLYSGQVSLVPQKGEPRPGCGERACWHTHCAAAVDLALDTLAAARSFGVEELALLTQVTNYTRPTNSIADAPVLPRSLFPPNCNGFFSIADAPVLLPPPVLRATDK